MPLTTIDGKIGFQDVSQMLLVWSLVKSGVIIPLIYLEDYYGQLWQSTSCIKYIGSITCIIVVAEEP